jgi:hypothetical protein
MPSHGDLADPMRACMHTHAPTGHPSTHPLLVPHAGHCKRLAPTWKELGDKLAGTPGVSIGFIDCTAHRDICTKAEVGSQLAMATFRPLESPRKEGALAGKGLEGT